MDRRTFLATAGTALLAPLAGCAPPGPGIRVESADDAELGERVARPFDSLRPELRPTITEGTTVTGRGRTTPVAAGTTVAYEGAVYELTTTVTAEEPARIYGISVETPDENATGGRAYADLPPIDRERVGPLLDEFDEAPSDEEDVSVSDPVLYNRSAAEASALVDEESEVLLTRGGRRYRVAVRGGEDVTEQQYRITASRRADTLAAYGRQVRSEWAFDLTGLSEAEAQLLDDARGETYYVDEEDEEAAYRSLLRRLREHDPIPPADHQETYVVRYDGEVLWISVEPIGMTLTSPGA
jgi:hypothetical protein